eukprot:4485-Heterococcus_DN1.PRE.2
MEGCVYNCRHPLYGGNGSCVVVNKESVCLCPPGYTAHNDLQLPSCVPTRLKDGVCMTWLNSLQQQCLAASPCQR